eukprot:1154615-Pelagomonas_calceolata.AAC.5
MHAWIEFICGGQKRDLDASKGCGGFATITSGLYKMASPVSPQRQERTRKAVMHDLSATSNQTKLRTRQITKKQIAGQLSCELTANSTLPYGDDATLCPSMSTQVPRLTFMVI